MKVGEIDTTGEIWIYRPVKHKGTWRGHGKAVALGKPEQGIIAPRLTGKGPDEAVFSPKDTLAERKERDAAKRKTKVQPSQVERAKRHTENPKSRAREHYDSQSYARSIKYAIIRANRSLPAAERIPHWTPYQLRHAAVTEIALENNGNLDIARAEWLSFFARQNAGRRLRRGFRETDRPGSKTFFQFGNHPEAAGLRKTLLDPLPVKLERAQADFFLGGRFRFGNRFSRHAVGVKDNRDGLLARLNRDRNGVHREILLSARTFCAIVKVG